MKQTFESIFMMRSPGYGFLLPRMRAALGVDEVRFEDITSVNMIKFREYMMGEVANNSLKTYFAVIKSVINICHGDGLIRSNKCVSELHVKAEPSENVYLTEEELDRMDKYFDKIVNIPERIGERDCLCLFLIENVTGARTSDCIGISEDNIRDNKLTYISKKTKNASIMPVHSKLQKYLKYKPKKDYSRAQKNRVIKKVAKECGIDQVIKLFYRGKWRKWPKYMYLSTHTGRRDFATLLDRRGAPISEICQFMNHKKNISMTMRYIIPDYDKVSREAMSFFS